jgi:hypothetical protein
VPKDHAVQLAAGGHDAQAAEPARAHHVNFKSEVALGLDDVVHSEKRVQDRKYLSSVTRTSDSTKEKQRDG